MSITSLEFEKPIAELEGKIEDLKKIGNNDEFDIQSEINNLKKKSEHLTKKIFSNLDEWQISQLARHPLRPYFLDYVELIFTDFVELHGDRHFADDLSIVGGLARLDGESVMIIGHQKGRSTNEKIRRNFGMPRPEGYRKALRLMKLAEQFRIPLLTFIDTPGAYPGIDAEARGQSEAIANNLLQMSKLKTPIISTIIGEGGSGGALAIGVSDFNLMLEFTTYSVISPEGCASILWKNADYACDAAKALGINAKKLEKLGLADVVVEEPLGSAYRNPKLAASNLKSSLISHLNQLKDLSLDDLLTRRYNRYMNYGNFKSIG